MQGNNSILGGGGIHHAAITVKDFDRTLKFYEEVLGFKEAISWGGKGKRAAMLDAGDGSCFEVFEGTPGERRSKCRWRIHSCGTVDNQLRCRV